MLRLLRPRRRLRALVVTGKVVAALGKAVAVLCLGSLTVHAAQAVAVLLPSTRSPSLRHGVCMMRNSVLRRRRVVLRVPPSL